jgi:hypothetical protein
VKLIQPFFDQAELQILMAEQMIMEMLHMQMLKAKLFVPILKAKIKFRGFYIRYC